MNITDSISQYASTKPDALALVSQPFELTWRQLDRLIWSCAHLMAIQNLKPGDRVGLVLNQGIRQLVVSLALARLGVSHLTMSALDSPETRANLSQSLGLCKVFSDIPDVVASTPLGIEIGRIPLVDLSADQKSSLRHDRSDTVWLLLQSYSPGGQVRHAELTHANVHDRSIRFRQMHQVNDHDIFWAASNPGFVAIKQKMVQSLMNGAAVCLPVNNQISPELVAYLKQVGITLAFCTPSQMQSLISIGLPIESLRVFEASTATISEAVRRDFKTRISPHLSIVYGTNEGGIFTVASPELQDAVPMTVGCAAPGILLEITNDAGERLGPLESGRIRVKGPGIVNGFLDNPKDSQSAVKNEWYYPGDLGYLTDQGALVLQGRADEMMIFDGMNIFPAEIERALCMHNAISEAVVLSIRHPKYQDVPMAAVILHAPATENELLSHCGRLLGLKAPRNILIVKEFPRNKAGLVDKQHLTRLMVDKLKMRAA
jgi:acyl-CoA synthetase (AMP-forming)/AMP-acid ligase II